VRRGALLGGGPVRARIADLESVIGRFTAARCKLAAVSGDMDLSSDAGRTVARMLSVIAQGEVERKGERQKLAAEASARAGKRFVGGHRPFGFQLGGVTAEPSEADAIASACRALLAGSTLSSVCRDWTARGLRPVQSKSGRWTRQSIGVILKNPRIAGLAVYADEIIGTGQWDALISEETFRAVHTLLASPSRKPSRGVRTLLGGLARCQCGNIVTASQNSRGSAVYRCNPEGRIGDGPHVARVIALADAFIRAVVIERMSRDDASDLIAAPSRADTIALRDEAQAIRGRRAQLIPDETVGLITRADRLAGMAAADRRLAEIDGQLADAGRQDELAPLVAAENVTEAFDGLDLARKRAVIRRLMSVTLRPAGRGAKRFDPESVVIGAPE
jgi:site-specific DNA recombinase